MILSYESLLLQWILDGRADKIISIKHNKKSQMDFFLSRDSQELINKVKDNDNKTLVALLRCFDDQTITNLKETPQSDDQKDILYDLDDSEALSKTFLAPEVDLLSQRDLILVV